MLCFFYKKNSHDCGFFMLKYLELWDGKQMVLSEHSDMEDIRKLYTRKWQHFSGNKVFWQKVLRG